MDSDFFVDLCDTPDVTNNKISVENNSSYDFDKTTMETYRVMRELKLDPISHQKVPEELQFNFKHMWNPFTGEITEIDRYGPLCFNVLTLVTNFYYNRLRMLWTNGETIDGIKYEGYYGDGVGSGENLYIPNKGDNKHLYLFRLPIIDCYLSKNFNMSVITMGPKITNEDILTIQTMIDNYYEKNKKITKKIKCNLVKMKELYDIAISKSSTDKMTITAIEQLKKMKLY